MFKTNSKIKLEVEVTVQEALKAMTVLGRTNGRASGSIYHAIKDLLDPKDEYVCPIHASRAIGIIQYVQIENEVETHFFNLHFAKKRNELRAAEIMLQEAQERVNQLKSEIGE